MFGSSDEGVRSLSGVLSVATLPIAWLIGRRFAGRAGAWILLVFLASAPFAVYYATEARMYALVMFLAACGILALARALERPRPGNLVALAVVTGALLYTQYWALYLVGSVGVWLLFQLWRGRPAWRPSARWAFGAVVVGCLTFVPWVPTFVFQSRHTGTPWAGTPTYAAIINAVTGFTDNQASLSLTGSNQGRLLALGYFTLAGLALFGLARDRWHIDIDVRTRPLARGLAFVVTVDPGRGHHRGHPEPRAPSPRVTPRWCSSPCWSWSAIGALTLADTKLRTVLVGVVAAGRAGRRAPQPVHPTNPGPRGGRRPRRPGPPW